MKLLLIAIYLVFYFLVGIFINIEIRTLQKKDPVEAYHVSNRIVRHAFNRILQLAGVRRIVKGAENIPSETALYVGNHRSYFDILTTHVTIKQPIGYVAKAEMTNIPFLAQWMKNIGCLFLDRKDNKKALKTILDGANMLKSGQVSLFIFPEGTRGHGDEIAPFKKGSFKMAERAQVPIVPVGIIGTDKIFENNGAFRKVRGGKVYLNFGKPIDTTNLTPEQKRHIDSYVQNIVADLIQELKDEYHL